jgi:hypothetical protein
MCLSFMDVQVENIYIYNVYRLLLVRKRIQNCCCNGRNTRKPSCSLKYSTVQSEVQHSSRIAFIKIHIFIPVVDVKL